MFLPVNKKWSNMLLWYLQRNKKSAFGVYLNELYANTHVATQEEWAARKLQCIVRKKRAWGKILAMLNDVYEKEYDPGTDSWFYVNKVGSHCAVKHHSVTVRRIAPKQYRCPGPRVQAAHSDVHGIEN